MNKLIKNDMYLTNQGAVLTKLEVISSFEDFAKVQLKNATKYNQYDIRYFSFQDELGLMMSRRDSAQELEYQLHCRLEHDISKKLNERVV
jgi:hypothetical protein